MQNTANSAGSISSANRLSPSKVAESSGPGSFPHVPPAGPSRAALIFRVVRWTTYGSAFILLVLLLHKTAPPPVATNAEAATRAEQKFADVQQAVAQGQPATLRMNETELNSYLATHLDFGGNPGAGASAEARGASSGADTAAAGQIESARSNVRDVKVQLVEDRVKAYVVFDVHGKDMTLQLEGRLGARDGFLRFYPVRGQIGALPIPQSMLQAAVRKKMESPENRDKLKLPDEISDLRIENGEVVATYQEP
jgi:hypothetical protein